MKINANHIAIVEWIIALILLLLVIYYSMFSYGRLTPLAAHERSERTYHYGPSKIVKSIEVPKGRIYLCRYKDWFSADFVKKGIVMWYPGSGPEGKKIDFADKVTYSWDYQRYENNKGITKIYGYVNDSNITKISAISKADSEVLSYNLDKSRMFIFYWTGLDGIYQYKTLQGFDKNGKLIYEKKLLE